MVASSVMQWSSRRAGVLLARNMQYKQRSLAISLAIVLSLTLSSANGFTIRRIDASEPTKDLEAGESAMQEARYNLKIPKDVSKFDGGDSNGESNNAVIALKESNNATTIIDKISKTSTTVKHDGISLTTEQKITTKSRKPKTDATDSSTDLITTPITVATKNDINVTNASIHQITPVPEFTVSAVEEVSTKIVSDDILTSAIPLLITTVTENNLIVTNTSTYPTASSPVILVQESDIDAINIGTKPSYQNNNYVPVTPTYLSTSAPELPEPESKVDAITINNKSTYPATTAEPSNDLSIQNNSTTNNDVTNTASIQNSDSLDLPYATSSEKLDTTIIVKSLKDYDMQASSTVMINNATSSAQLDGSFMRPKDEETTTTVKINDETKTVAETSVTSFESTTNKIDIEISATPVNIVSLPTLDERLKLNTEPTFGNDSIIEDITTTTDVITDTTNIDLENNPPTSTEFRTEETFNTETVTLHPTTLPPWKIYKTIKRKRPSTTSTEETTFSDIEMTRAETARIAIAEVLSNTPIPSLEELKNDLLKVQDYTTRTVYTNATEVNNSRIPDVSTPMPAQNTSDKVEIQHPKLEIVSSMRAGYIDNTETTTQPQKVITTDFIYKATGNDTETYGTMYETDVGDTELSDVTENKNYTGMESQSQLVEDAIKEELLMERTINENELLKNVHHVKPAADNSPTLEITPTVQEIVTEDMLSVKPISPEKKTSVLYAVSPNYKPLKKLEIQPPKLIFRNPDDNSWRNESISSLGIVFKPKNASKSFTEVLKNKTTELAYMSEREDKNDVPDLRVRLEKIAEVRKSKKKKINKFGDTVYSDYEENSGENIKSSKEDITSPMMPSRESDLSSTTPVPPSLPRLEDDLAVYAIAKENMNAFKDEFSSPPTTVKGKKLYHFGFDYDGSDEYDTDYVTLPKIDLKKFTVKQKDLLATHPPMLVTRPFDLMNTKPMGITYPPDRQPTVQYFPPTKKATPRVMLKDTEKVTQKVNMNDYDDDFKNKVNLYVSNTEPPKTVYEVSFGTATPLQTKKIPLTRKPSPDKNLYLTNQRVTEPMGGFVPNDGNFNRASYVIKHYRDFIDDASKANEDEKTDFLPYTEPPIRGVTMSDVSKYAVAKDAKSVEDYDYGNQFRKDVVNRFVDNFNQNSEKFKVDFPILYNSSVVHRKVDENGKVLASSTAFMKRVYETVNTRPNFLNNVRPCDANCQAMTVDLSPAYELHYYVPEQEEKEEMEPRSAALPYHYRL